ncbi:MAG TPA: menaquinone biosynthesis protein [Desulfuromonadaceae bacterium]|jgi:chorismate dehydratase
MIRIGQIEYANCTPIFHALKEQFSASDYEYVGGVPAQLNELLAAGAIDVCPSSSIAYALQPERYLIIPDLSISSCGPVQSVLLFSVMPIEELNGNSVLLTAESATSVNLLKILLDRRFACKCTFSTTRKPLEEALKEAPAVLLIGDSALRASQSASSLFVYDLGDLWYTWTKTPFVFALWLASRSAFEVHSDELHELAGHLQKCKTYAYVNLERIVDASPDVVWMGREGLLRYWRKNITYDLSDEHRSGLKLFFQLAAEMKLIPYNPELAFLE